MKVDVHITNAAQDDEQQTQPTDASVCQCCGQSLPSTPAKQHIDTQMTSREVADLLGVSTRTLSRWRSQRFGPPWHALSYNIVTYDREAVLSWKRRHKHVAKPRHTTRADKLARALIEQQWI